MNNIILPLVAVIATLIFLAAIFELVLLTRETRQEHKEAKVTDTASRIYARMTVERELALAAYATREEN